MKEFGKAVGKTYSLFFIIFFGGFDFLCVQKEKVPTK